MRSNVSKAFGAFNSVTITEPTYGNGIIPEIQDFYTHFYTLFTLPYLLFQIGAFFSLLKVIQHHRKPLRQPKILKLDIVTCISKNIYKNPAQIFMVFQTKFTPPQIALIMVKSTMNIFEKGENVLESFNNLHVNSSTIPCKVIIVWEFGAFMFVDCQTSP